MKMGEAHWHDRQVPCLNCGEKLDGASVIDESDKLVNRNPAPRPGDFTICIKCAHLMIFSDDGGFREPTKEEAFDIAGDKRLLAAVEAISQAQARTKKKSQA